jgi:hypothetical protein
MRLRPREGASGPARSPQPAPAPAAGGTGGGAEAAPPLLLQLAMCIACTAHSALAEHAEHQGAGGTYSDSLQRSVVRGYALAALAELAARLATAACTACSGAGAGSNGSAALDQLLLPLGVLLKWMVGPLPSSTKALVPAEQGAGAKGAGAPAEQSAALAAALRRFWASAAQLLPALRAAIAAGPDPAGPAAAGAGAAGVAAGAAGVAEAGAGGGLFLPEDLHCRCFAPLGPGAEKPSAPGEGAAPGPTSEPSQQGRLRVRRVLAAAEALAAALGCDMGEGAGSSVQSGPLAAFLAAARGSDREGGSTQQAQQQLSLQQAQQAQQQGQVLSAEPRPAQDEGPGGAAAGMEIDGGEEEEVRPASLRIFPLGFPTKTKNL